MACAAAFTTEHDMDCPASSSLTDSCPITVFCVAVSTIRLAESCRFVGLSLTLLRRIVNDFEYESDCLSAASIVMKCESRLSKLSRVPSSTLT